MIALKKITIIGGAGFIGTKLTEELLFRGYAVCILDKRVSGVTHLNLISIQTDTSKSIEGWMLADSFGVVNLAGAPISKRWSKKYKEIIYTSRIITTQKIVHALAELPHKPEVFVSASAVGYYGDHGEEKIVESEEPGTDFLSKLCVDWEQEAMKAKELGVRVVTLRTANVLGPGGLLKTLHPLFRFGVGGYFGSGKQYMPWVYWKDIIGIYIFAIENMVGGAYNTAAPEAVTQKQLFTSFGRWVQAPYVLSIPVGLTKIIIGEFANTLTISQRIDSTRVQESGYRFKFPTLEQAFSDLA
jgi:uncharacterized protein (TIGR01777 family)